MARSETWGATSILAGVYFSLPFFDLISFWRIGMIFFSSLFSTQENIETRGFLFTKGLDILLQHTGQPHHTQQNRHSNSKIAASRYRYLSFYLFLILFFGFYCIQFCFSAVWFRLVLRFSSHHSFTIISIFIEGACLVGFLWILFPCRFSFSLSYIYFISTSCPGDFVPLVFAGDEDQQACRM